MAANTREPKDPRRLVHSLHDGTLDGLRVTPEGSDLILACRDVEGRSWRITIPAIDRLRATEFWAGNIIFGLFAYVGEGIPEKLVQALLQPSRVSPEVQVRRYREGMIGNQWTLIELTCSYGCELWAASKAGPEAIVVEGTDAP